MKQEEIEEKFSRLSKHIEELIENSTIAMREYEEIKDTLEKMYIHSIKQQKKIEKYEKKYGKII